MSSTLNLDGHDPSVVTDTTIAALVACDGDPRSVVDILRLSRTELASLADEPGLSAETRGELEFLIATAPADCATGIT